jgi:ankyrin repeat protein
MDPFAKGWQVSSKQPTKVKKIDQDLLNAAYFGNDRDVRKYIAMGGDINFMEDRDGWMGIHYAARWGNIPMLNAYLKAGSDVDSKTKNKETSLHKCARWNTKDCAILLLKNGANPTIKNSDGNIPSDMTNEPETIFLLDHFEEYMNIRREHGIQDISYNTSQKSKFANIKSPVAEYIRNKKKKQEFYLFQPTTPNKQETKLNIDSK